MVLEDLIERVIEKSSICHASSQLLLRVKKKHEGAREEFVQTLDQLKQFLQQEITA